MFSNYIKIALRNFFKNKVFTGITVFGLSVGIACFILLFLYVRHELSFDHFHEKKDRIFRLVTDLARPEGCEEKQYASFIQPSLPEVIRDDNPSIKNITRYMQTGFFWIESEEKMRKDDIAWADPDFLNMFSFPLLIGDSETALNDPDSILLTESLAKFYFGDVSHDYSQVLGKTVSISILESRDYIVRGILKDLPDNSIFSISALVRYDEELNICNTEFGKCHVFAELDSKEHTQSVEQNITNTFQTVYSGPIKFGQKNNRLENVAEPVKCVLQPLDDVYRNEDVFGEWDYVRHGSSLYTYILTALATLILLIASINAVVIKLGQAAARAREVGVRKVVGANRGQLITQFFVEAFLLCSFSLTIAILFAELLLPSFNSFTSKQLELGLFKFTETPLFLLCILAATTLIIGGVPSLTMSRFSALTALKFNKPTRGRGSFTSILVVAQFSITIILLFSTYAMQSQLHHSFNRPTGYNKEGVLVLSLPFGMNEERENALKERIQRLPSIINVGGSDRNFNSGVNRGGSHNQYGEFISVRNIAIDEDFLDTLNIDFIEGRNFSESYTAERKTAIIVNETLAKQYGFDEPIGKRIHYWGKQREIIGVVKDFHIDSFHRKLEPLLMQTWSNVRYHFIRYREGQVEQARKGIESIWKTMEPIRPIELSFLDEILQQQYEDHQRWKQIVSMASVIAIILSCMSLWGITAMAISRRIKEIGIRKVMGADESGILSLFAVDIIKLFGFSIILAVPVGSYLMQKFLNEFAYRIQLPWWGFIEAGLFSIVVALLTVSWLVIRVALNNPIDALRYE